MMEYAKLNQQEESSDGSETSRQDESLYRYLPTVPQLMTGQSVLHFGYFVLLLTSIFFNGVAYMRSGSENHEYVTKTLSILNEQDGRLDLEQKLSVVDDISPYSEIARDQLKPLVEQTSYHTPENWTLAHEKWRSIDTDWAVITLDDEFVKRKNLLMSTNRFPWDNSKGIYLLHGMHTLHCLKIIYLEFRRYQNNEEPTIPWGHISHCFDTIRQQIVCDADDTPRVSFSGQHGVSGIGQSRKCRSWEAYEAFARNHTACYKRREAPRPGVPDIEDFKFCPPGSGYVVRNGKVIRLD